MVFKCVLILTILTLSLANDSSLEEDDFYFQVGEEVEEIEMKNLQPRMDFNRKVPDWKPNLEYGKIRQILNIVEQLPTEVGEQTIKEIAHGLLLTDVEVVRETETFSNYEESFEDLFTQFEDEITLDCKSIFYCS